MKSLVVPPNHTNNSEPRGNDVHKGELIGRAIRIKRRDMVMDKNVCNT